MKISVIMRTKNSCPTVIEALESLFAQQLPVDVSFELLVVDSGSTDDTLKHVARYPHRLISIAPEAYFPGKVLNQAAQAAQGDILVFQNSDVVLLHPEALWNLVSAIGGHTVASFARQLCRPEARLDVQRDYAISFPEQGPPPAWMTYSLPFAAMKRSAWEKAPFYTWAWGSEDTEWGHRHRSQIAYVPEARVMHSHNYTYKQMLGRHFIEGEADAWMTRKNISSAHGLRRRCARLVSHCLRDLHYGMGSRSLLASMAGAATGLTYRATAEWGSYRGFCLGKKRLRQAAKTGGERGQRFALAHYD